MVSADADRRDRPQTASRHSRFAHRNRPACRSGNSAAPYTAQRQRDQRDRQIVTTSTEAEPTNIARAIDREPHGNRVRELLILLIGIALGGPLAFLLVWFFAERILWLVALFAVGVVAVILLVIAFIAFAPSILLRVFGTAKTDLDTIVGEVGQAATKYMSRESAAATDHLVEAGRVAAARFTAIRTRQFIVYVLVSFVAAFAGLSTAALLFKQNELLGLQNDLLGLQNELVADQRELLRTQNSLAEAGRRASQINELTAILDSIDRERSMYSPESEPPFKPSPFLLSRIVVLSRNLKPYHFLDISKLGSPEKGKSQQPQLELTARPLSPERASLLIALASLGNDVLREAIHAGADFSSADLRDADLRKVDLSSASLEFADLRNSRTCEMPT